MRIILWPTAWRRFPKITMSVVKNGRLSERAKEEMLTRRCQSTVRCPFRLKDEREIGLPGDRATEIRRRASSPGSPNRDPGHAHRNEETTIRSARSPPDNLN